VKAIELLDIRLSMLFEMALTGLDTIRLSTAFMSLVALSIFLHVLINLSLLIPASDLMFPVTFNDFMSFLCSWEAKAGSYFS